MDALSSLGWALLHSLWQLALLGLLAWGLLRASARPRVRYALAMAMLVLMLVSLAFTWALFASGWCGPQPILLLEMDLGAVPPAIAAARTQVPGLGSLPGQQAWLAALPSWCAWAWLTGTGGMLGRFALSWFQGRRLFHHGTSLAPGPWPGRLARLARHVGLGFPVTLRMSPTVSSPMTWGWLRPVVLVPTAAFLNLRPEALEAVLAHELAHLRRFDFLAGLLQAVAETLLFYHPAVWWLSRQIRELREHCCDDDAVALCGDPLAYAEGLAELERLRRGGPLPALAHASQKGNLMLRLKRLFQPSLQPPPAFRGIALALAAGLVGGLLLAGSRTTSGQVPPAPVSPSPVTITYWEKEILVDGMPGVPDLPKALRGQAAARLIQDQMRLGFAQLQARRDALKAGEPGRGPAARFQKPASQEVPKGSILLVAKEKTDQLRIRFSPRASFSTFACEVGAGRSVTAPLSAEEELQVLEASIARLQAVAGNSFFAARKPVRPRPT